MIDREKVVTVLRKRFPAASTLDIAAAANAIVGLPLEYDLLGSIDFEEFACAADRVRYTLDDLIDGRIRVYRRRREQL
jgi:hypothetical protein